MFKHVTDMKINEWVGHLKIPFTIGMLFLLAGCVTLYKPNVLHTPMLKEKGDANFSAAVGLTGNGLFNGQAAYAVSDHAGIMINGMYHHRQSGGDNSSVEKLNIFSGEAGGGYFKSFGKNENKLFQCYGGLGYGHTTDKIESTGQANPEASARYVNVFVQPGFALMDKRTEFSFDLRANYVQLFDIHAYLYDQFEWWNTDFKYYSDTTINFMNLEPAVTFKVGGNRLKGTCQVGMIIPAVNSKSYFDVNNASLLGVSLIKISFGVNYFLGRRKEGK
jgi:hypothetical protein